MSLSIELAGIISVKLTRNIRKSIYKLPTNENADQQLILFLCKRLLLQSRPSPSFSISKVLKFST